MVRAVGWLLRASWCCGCFLGFNRILVYMCMLTTIHPSYYSSSFSSFSPSSPSSPSSLSPREVCYNNFEFGFFLPSFHAIKSLHKTILHSTNLPQNPSQYPPPNTIHIQPYWTPLHIPHFYITSRQNLHPGASPNPRTSFWAHPPPNIGPISFPNSVPIFSPTVTHPRTSSPGYREMKR